VEAVGGRTADCADREDDRESGNQPRNAEHEGREQRDTDGALRDPVGTGVDPVPVDRLMHRRRL